MFYIGRFGGINTQVRAISCFDSTITNTTGSRGSRQNSVHAGPPPKIHSPLHASTTSKNVFVRRPHRFQALDPPPRASDPLPTPTLTSQHHHHKVPMNFPSTQSTASTSPVPSYLLAPSSRYGQEAKMPSRRWCSPLRVRHASRI